MKNTTSKGFTLVEIMIVVAIIALLAAIAVPNFLRARERSQATSVLNEARMIDSAIDQWAIENNKGKNDTATAKEIANYLKAGTKLQTEFAGGGVKSPTLNGVTFTIGTVGSGKQVTITGTTAFDTNVVPATFWAQFSN